MAFSGEDATLITIDGYAQCEMTPFGGSAGIIGCVAELKADGKKIVREITSGTPLVGVDQMISGKLAQTTPADVSNMVGAIALSSIRAIGARNTAVITAPSGRKLWMNFDTQLAMSNKPDSAMIFEVTKPGQAVSSLTSFIIASS